jgi:hypothetical protein
MNAPGSRARIELKLAGDGAYNGSQKASLVETFSKPVNAKEMKPILQWLLVVGGYFRVGQFRQRAIHADTGRI